MGERIDGVLGEGARDNRVDLRLGRGELGIMIARGGTEIGGGIYAGNERKGNG